MTSRKASAALRIGMVIAVSVGGFLLFEHPIRLVETLLAVHLAGLFGAHQIQIVGGTSILEEPWHGPAFLAIVTPSCSSAASIMSLTGLGLLVRRAGVTRARRAGALIAACTLVFLGNVLRIGGALVIGLVAGRFSLVMFHDWIGSMFSFGYTLGGFILMLWLVLDSPANARQGFRPRLAGARGTERSTAVA